MKSNTQREWVESFDSLRAFGEPSCGVKACNDLWCYADGIKIFIARIEDKAEERGAQRERERMREWISSNMVTNVMMNYGGREANEGWNQALKWMIKDCFAPTQDKGDANTENV